MCPLLEKYGTFIARCNALIEKVSPFRAARCRTVCGVPLVRATGAQREGAARLLRGRAGHLSGCRLLPHPRNNARGHVRGGRAGAATGHRLCRRDARGQTLSPFAPQAGKGCYVLVFVQLFEKYGTLIERHTALIEKVSALTGTQTPAHHYHRRSLQCLDRSRRAHLLALCGERWFLPERQVMSESA
eukprot:SAG31_NODE_1638_length_7672_cov_4.225142_8_plen_187_part_00